MTGEEGRGGLEREMGLDHADFWRLLPQALGPHAWKREGNRVTVEIGGGHVEIELGPQRERRIALMTIPATPVSISWRGVDRDTRARFLERFDSYYRRGGG
ncbi:MAG: hypothetical protein R3298_07845 [Gammaproteobacteria bacterium]|nr:hypothetical protein [Gammaproteobacteria bacterium]